MKADYKNWVPDGGTGLDVEIIFFGIWLAMPNYEDNNNKEWRFECQKNLS